MAPSRLPPGRSDPLSYTCTCPVASSSSGLVLLFYRYFANSPALPSRLPLTAASVSSLAAFHTSLTTRLFLTGKIRVAEEGFNVTVAGTRDAIAEYMAELVAHWSFLGLELEGDGKEEERRKFFKPGPGCACVFAPATVANVRVCGEITPMGVTDYKPRRWDVVEELEPEEWHRRCLQGGVGGVEGSEAGVKLLDMRNHYESQLGWFVGGAGEKAEVLQVRRFSQIPIAVRRGRVDALGLKSGRDEGKEKDQVLTYCTGGVRCEKLTRWIAEKEGGEGRRICTLKGGIQAYMDWVDVEVEAARMKVGESLFKGKNYVFDARGAVGLRSEGDNGRKVAECHGCGRPEDRLGKCASDRCHLVLVLCGACEAEGVRCCQSCGEMDVERKAGRSRGRKMCGCEEEREKGLWGVQTTTL